MPEYPIMVGHSDYSDPEYCRIIMPVARARRADLVCNECGAVLYDCPHL